MLKKMNIFFSLRQVMLHSTAQTHDVEPHCRLRPLQPCAYPDQSCYPDLSCTRVAMSSNSSDTYLCQG